MIFRKRHKVVQDAWIDEWFAPRQMREHRLRMAAGDVPAST